jgi:hypothetical protein
MRRVEEVSLEARVGLGSGFGAVVQSERTPALEHHEIRAPMSLSIESDCPAEQRESRFPPEATSLRIDVGQDQWSGTARNTIA